MTIAELIIQLQEYPEKMEVIVFAEIGYSPIYIIDKARITGDYIVVEDHEQNDDAGTVIVLWGE